MKINMIRYAFAAFAALLPLAAMGQNLDPTVEVSRTYEGKLMEVHKPQLKMAVPDSVLRFDLDFDYSVTDTPYRGTYEFKPYSVDMKPSPTVRRHETFRLKVGAGYQLHPVFDMVWSPKFKTNAFRMNVYAAHNSFFGNYWKMAEPVLTEPVVIGRMEADGAEKRTWAGYDMDTKAGVNGRADWEKGIFIFDLGYSGIHQKDAYIEPLTRYFYSLDGKLGVASKKHTGFLYKADLSYSFAEDALTFMRGDNWYQKATEVDFDSSWGYVLNDGGKIVLGIDLNAAFMSGAESYQGTEADIVPRYLKEVGRWRFDLGVRLSAALSTSRFIDTYGVDGQLFYPDVRIEYMAVKDALKLYVDVGGDSELNSYSDLLAHNRRANSGYCRFAWELMDVSEEKVNAALGVESRIGKHFSFDLKGGYVKYADALMDGVERKEGTSAGPAIWLPALGYGSYDKSFAAFGWLLDTESVRFGGNIEYAYSWAEKADDVKGLFMPAAVTGEVSFMYDWRDRIFAGVDCGFSTARKSSAIYYEGMYGGSFDLESVGAEIPGYADLGISLKYAVNRKFSVWARGGNLLGMTVQKSILYAEKGPYFTAGICLNL